MRRETNTGQRKEVELNRGLFLVHYKSAEDEDFPPLVKVFPAPGHERQVQIHCHPDSDPNTLWQPNTSLVVRATGSATLHVEVLPRRANGSRNAAVRIEPINQGSASQPADFSGQALPDVNQIRIVGHVAGIGDVVVSADEWIAGPSAPSRIEGIAIEWPQQTGLELRYAVKSGTQMAKMVEAGEFAGTRGRAMPLTGLILELSGKFGDSYELAADAIFLSSPTMRVIGKRIVLSGPTGREPLVGLRLRIQSSEQEQAVPPRTDIPERGTKNTVSPAKPVAKPVSSGKVRVFRSRTKQPSD